MRPVVICSLTSDLLQDLLLVLYELTEQRYPPLLNQQLRVSVSAAGTQAALLVPSLGFQGNRLRLDRTWTQPLSITIHLFNSGPTSMKYLWQLQVKPRKKHC